MSEQLSMLIQPVVSKASIKRVSLIHCLKSHTRQRIVFIYAPAGYGKTTIVAQWLAETGKNAAWVALDEYCATSSDIYAAMLRSMSCHEKLYDDHYITLGQMLEILSSHNTWPQALIIDDFHLCNDNSVVKALPLIRARLPSDMAFVVISRNPPPSLLNDLIIKGALFQITRLMFDEHEIIELFDKNGCPISKSQAKCLKEKTGGWAAALSAILMAQGDNRMFPGLLDQSMLNQYMRSHIFEFYNEFHVLKKCAVCDTLYPQLCAAVTGCADAWEIITAFAKKTGLITRFDENAYRFHSLLREFLLCELRADNNIDKPSLYNAAANFYKEGRDYIRALNMAAKSGSIFTMEEMTRSIYSDYGHGGTDIDGYVNYIEKNLLSIPRHICEQYPRLSLQCYLGAFQCRPIDETLLWLNVIEMHIKADCYRQDDLIPAAFLLAIDPRFSSWCVPKQFARIAALLPTVGEYKPQVFTLTHNLPYFHKAQRDYTDITKELPEFIKAISKCMAPFLGPEFKPLVLLLEAGISYEQNKLPQAEQTATDAVRISNQSTPEIRFCALAIYFEILRVQGEKANTKCIGDMIDETNAYYLAENFHAYETDLQLYNGDTDSAALWVKHVVNDEAARTLKFYKIAQYFTTARALIVLKKFPDAMKLLDRLVSLSQTYRRNADYIEATVMQSICYWNMKCCDMSINTMIIAINKSKNFQIVMPIIKLGNDILPILQKILRRLQRGYDTDILDKAFVNLLFINTKIISKNVRGMFSESSSKPVKLSPRQKEILEYLSQSMTYQEISEKTGVKITTVRDHVSKIYEKLGVSVAADAILKAKEMNLLKIL